MLRLIYQPPLQSFSWRPFHEGPITHSSSSDHNLLRLLGLLGLHLGAQRKLRATNDRKFDTG